MTDTLHERVTEDATDAPIAVATGATGARVWPEAVNLNSHGRRGAAPPRSMKQGGFG